MKKIWLILALFGYSLLSLNTGCSNGGKSDRNHEGSTESGSYESYKVDEVAQSAEETTEAENNSTSEDADYPLEPMVIKTASADLNVKNLDTAEAYVRQTVKKFNARIHTENTNENEFEKTTYLTLKIANKSFDDLLSAIKKCPSLNEVQNLSVNAEDVTEEFIDVSARLKVKKATEATYLDLLKKANSISEVIEVEKELSEIRGQIESMEGRIKYLKSQSSESTLNLTLIQKFTNKKGFGYDLQKSFTEGWHLFLKFLTIVGYLWVFIVVGGIGIFIIVRRERKKAAERRKLYEQR